MPVSLWTRSLVNCSSVKPTSVVYGINFYTLLLYASPLDKPYYYGNNRKNKQKMNDASRVKGEKP